MHAYLWVSGGELRNFPPEPRGFLRALRSCAPQTQTSAGEFQGALPEKQCWKPESGSRTMRNGLLSVLLNSTPAASDARALRRGAGRRWRLNKPTRGSLLFLQVSDESFRVIAALSEQLLAMAMQLFNKGIVGHWESPSNSSGVHTNGMLKPASSTKAVTRGNSSALAIWRQFQVSR
jgi:hypothetical protein